VRELVLVAQDLTSWGSDFDTPQSLPHLLDELLPLDRLTWLRLLYLYPSGVTPEMLRYMREAGPQLLPYFDIPLQHAHPEVLTRMGRPFANDPRRVVDRVREALPEAALRTTFIVGYPGETEAEFQTLLDWMDEAQLDRVGCFQYENVAGARSNDLPDHVPAEVKQERWDRFMAKAQAISEAKLAARVGQVIEVIVDEVDDEAATCRTKSDAPEIDGNLFIDEGFEGLQPGDIVTVEVDEAGEYDLWGRLR